MRAACSCGPVEKFSLNVVAPASQFLDPLGTLGGWSDGGHDLGPSVQVELGHIELKILAETTIRAFPNHYMEMNFYQDSAKDVPTRMWVIRSIGLG